MKWKHCIVLLIAAMLFLTSSVGASAEAVLELPSNLEVIEEEAFMGNTSLGSVILPDGIKSIGDRAFANSSLVEIYLPRSLNTISENAFEHHRPALIIKGETGTLAETYANNHDILFVAVNHEPTVVLADSWEEFAGASIAMIQDYSSAVSVSSSDATYATGRLIVKVEDELPDVSNYNIASIVRDPENHYLLQFLSDVEAVACADYLTGLPGVIYAEPDIFVSGSTGDSVYGDEVQSNSWGVSATHADAYAADLKARGVTSTVVVAVVDTGVDSSHPMLAGRVISGYDFIQNDTTPQDGHGHGTHVSGTVLDCTPGLNVKVMPVRVLDNGGSGTSSIVGQGIRYAALNGASVINLSLGGGHSNYKDEAIEYALSRGATVVVAAGNENKNTNSCCPAHIRSCVTVSAVDSSKQKASFSNYGDAIDISAPGVSIKSSIPGGGYASWNGTSMAAPHVSAAAAMLIYENPNLAPSDVEAMLRNAATDIGNPGWDSYYGGGFLNMEPFIKGGPEKYIIAYDANGGTGAPVSQTKIKDTNLILSTVKPTKSCKVTLDYGNGYLYDKTVSSSFAWWNTKSDGTGTQYASGSTYRENAAATLYAQWDDGTLDSLPTPTRDGYSFAGWYTKPTGGSIVTTSTKITGNMTIYAHWEQLQTYAVTYDANGGSGGPSSQIKVEDVTLTLSTKRPSRASSTGSYTVTLNANGGSVSSASLTATHTTNYTFKNWNTMSNGSGTSYNAGASYTENADATLYAQWNSSTTTESVTLPTPTRAGYIFKGWATSSSASSGITGSYTPVGSIKLYAVWEELPKYTVAYNANGGTGAPANQSKTQGIVLYLSSTKPTRAEASAGRYTVTLDPNGGTVSQTSLIAERTIFNRFESWNTKADGTGDRYSAAGAYTKDAPVTLYAQWVSTTMTETVQLPIPSREGHSFEGWAVSQSAASGQKGSYTPTGDITFYAIWETEKYTVSYDANGGTGAPAAQTKTYGTDLTLAEGQPSRASTGSGSYTVKLDANGASVSQTSLVSQLTTAYSFRNWNTAKNGTGTSYAPGASYTDNTAATLYAQWQSNTTAAAVDLPVPERESYNFKGWAADRDAEAGISGSYTPSGNETLYAVWEVIAYNGECGENGSNLTWDLRLGTLTISGSGNMVAYSSENKPEWLLHKDKIRHIVIEGGVSSIGAYAFDGCDAVTDAAIPNSINFIGAYAFRSCSGLTELQLPAGLQQIENGSFAGCNGITDLTLPQNISVIEAEAFRDCTGLKSANIPKRIITIENAAFQNCTGLTDIYFDGTIDQWDDLNIGINNDALFIAELHVKDILGGGECGRQGDNLIWTLYGDGTLAIDGAGEMAYYSSTTPAPWSEHLAQIYSLQLSDGITAIGRYAFSGCNNLTDVPIPQSVTEIGQGAFENCTSLESISLPEELMILRWKVFNNCTGLKTVTIPIGVRCIETYDVFSNCPLSDVYYSGSEYDWNIIRYLGTDGWWTDHPSNIPELSTANIHFARYVTNAGNCGAQDGTVAWCLYDDGELSIRGVRMQEDSSWQYGGMMADYSSTSRPPWYEVKDRVTSVSITDGFAFYYVDRAYLDDRPHVTSIGDYAFADFPNLTNVTFPESVTAIGQSAFQNCISLMNVVIPESVTVIGQSAFRNCGSLTELTIPDGVSSIERYTFAQCGALENVTIPSSVTSIGLNAFQSCSSLTDVLIPESVTSIGQSAFQNCSGLNSAMIPRSLESLGRYAFYNCSSLSDVYFGGTQEQWETFSTIAGNEPLYSAAIHFNTLVPTYYTITYDANGGIGAPEPVKKAHGAEIILPETGPNRAARSAGYCTVRFDANGGSVSVSSRRAEQTTNYRFSGWNTEADGSGTAYAPGASYTGNGSVTLYAQWEASTETAALTLPTPTRSKYVFKGWATSTSASSGIIGSYTPVNDVTLYATWEYNSPVQHSGELGNITWKLHEDGMLIFSGTGAMNTNTSNSKWRDYYTLKSVLIEEGITTIGSNAFTGCNNLTSVTIPGTVASIGYGAFSSCRSLKSVTIPEGVTSIGTTAFSGCALTTVTIPVSVKSIGEEAFINNSIQDVYYAGSRAQWNAITIGSGNSALVNSGVTFHFGK